MKTLKNNLITQRQKLLRFSRRLIKSRTMILSQTTPYEVIGEYRYATIRYYPAIKKQFLEPIVFVPPLAVTVSIYDLFPYRSLIKHMQNSGFDVYLLDWHAFNYQDRFVNFMSFIDDMIPHCLDLIQQHARTDQVHLHGWSMGGLFVLLYQALHQPKHVKNLISLGAPVDTFRCGWHGKLAQYVHHLLEYRPAIGQYVYTGKIPKRILQTPGVLNSLVFKLIDPTSWLKSKKRYLTHLNHPRIVQEHVTMGHYLNHMIDYPGGINQDMLLNLWLQNPLASGEVVLHERKIQLKNIRCPLLIGAGDRDQLVPAHAIEPILAMVGSEDVSFSLIPGGHMGIMSNIKTANTFWPKLSAWLKQRSTHI